MSLTSTEKLAAIIQATDQYAKNFENRVSEVGAFKAFQNNSEMLLPASLLDGTKDLATRPQQIPVLNKQAADLITGQECSFTSEDATSQFQTLAYVPKGFKIQINEAVNAGNYITKDQEFAQKLIGNLKGIGEWLDTQSLGILETRRNVALASSTLATIANGAYVYSRDQYDKNRLYIDIPSIVGMNDINGVLNDISNLEEQSKMLEYRTLAMGNNQNFAGVVDGSLYGAGVFNGFITKRLALDGNKAIHYFAPEGGLGIYNYVDWESRMNMKLNDSDKKYVWQDPIFGIKWGVHERITCVKVGNVTNYLTTYEFYTEFAWLTQFSSDTTSSIIKVVVPMTDNA